MRFTSGYISVLHRVAQQFYNRHQDDTGISGIQYPYLFYICRHEGCRQEELVDHLRVNKSNVTRQLGKLQAEGFIDIRPDESDGRGNCVYPTQKALRCRDKVRGVLEEWNDIMCGALSDEEHVVLDGLLDKITKHVKQMK